VANDASKPQGVFSRVADTHRLEALLPGWRPSIDVDRGIGLVADFLRARRQAGGNHLTRAAE
jgi:hypothetical protein